MNIIGKKKSLDADPVTQTVTTMGVNGEEVRLTPFEVQHTDGDQVEGFGGVPVATEAALPRVRFQIKGVITVR